MQSHEHAMQDSITSHESRLDRLFDASNGFHNIDVECRHCGEPIVVDQFSTWTHDESCDESCHPNRDESTTATPSELFVSELESVGVDVDHLEESAMTAMADYGLSLDTSTILTWTIAVGGPTQYLSAPIEQNQYGSWVRTGDVTYFDSWAVPNETRLSENTSLVAVFDQHVESYVPAGPIVLSRLGGTPHRTCDDVGCNVISLPDDDDDQDA